MSVIDTNALLKAVPRVTLPNGKSACDHRSPEWKAYKRALAAKGLAYQARRLQKHFRTAVAQACAVVIADAEDYLNDLRSNINTVQ